MKAIFPLQELSSSSRTLGATPPQGSKLSSVDIILPAKKSLLGGLYFPTVQGFLGWGLQHLRFLICPALTAFYFSQKTLQQISLFFVRWASTHQHGL